MILIIDGASPHTTLRAAQLCRSLAIFPWLLRPNMTHLTQVIFIHIVVNAPFVYYLICLASGSHILWKLEEGDKEACLQLAGGN